MHLQAAVPVGFGHGETGLIGAGLGGNSLRIGLAVGGVVHLHGAVSGGCCGGAGGIAIGPAADVGLGGPGVGASLDDLEGGLAAVFIPLIIAGVFQGQHYLIAADLHAALVLGDGVQVGVLNVRRLVLPVVVLAGNGGSIDGGLLDDELGGGGARQLVVAVADGSGDGIASGIGRNLGAAVVGQLHLHLLPCHNANESCGGGGDGAAVGATARGDGDGDGLGRDGEIPNSPSFLMVGALCHADPDGVAAGAYRGGGGVAAVRSALGLKVDGRGAVAGIVDSTYGHRLAVIGLVRGVDRDAPASLIHGDGNRLGGDAGGPAGDGAGIAVAACVQVGGCGVVVLVRAQNLSAIEIPLVGYLRRGCRCLFDAHPQLSRSAIASGAAAGIGGYGQRRFPSNGNRNGLCGHGELVVRNGHILGHPLLEHIVAFGSGRRQGDGAAPLAVGLAAECFFNRVGSLTDGQRIVDLAAHGAAEGAVHIDFAVVCSLCSIQGHALGNQQLVGLQQSKGLFGRNAGTIDLAIIPLEDHALPIGYAGLVGDRAGENHCLAVFAGGELDSITAADAAGGRDGAAVDNDIEAPIKLSTLDAADGCAGAGAGGNHGAAADNDIEAPLKLSTLDAADGCAGAVAGGSHGAAADGDGEAVIELSLVMVAADAHATIAARGCHVAAADGDGIVSVKITITIVFFPTDACAFAVAGGNHGAAADGDFTGSADACIAVAAGGVHGAAADGDEPSVLSVSAIERTNTDAGTVFAAVGCNITAENANHAGLVGIIAVADACAVFTAGGCDFAAVDGDLAAARCSPRTANACCQIAAGGCDIAAVDDDIAKGSISIIVNVTAADGCIVFGCIGDQLAHFVLIRGLGIDAEAAA